MKEQLAILSLLLSVTALAQNTAELNTSKPPAIVWDLKDPRCKVVYYDGVPRETFQSDKLIIDVFDPETYDKHTDRVEIGINDLGAGDLDVDPRRFSAQANDAAHTLMPVIDADTKLVKDERHEDKMQAIGNALSGFGAGMSSRTATVNNSDGSTSQVTYHDPADTERAKANARANATATASYYGRLSSTILRRNSLTNGRFVAGYVYLDRPKGLNKKAKVDAIAIYVGGAVYIFPFKDGHAPRTP